jgi:hypothetical protein
MNKNIQPCDMPEDVNRFYENMKKRGLSCTDCHNIYVLETEDMEGNITGKAYGLNVMTNDGVWYMFRNSDNTPVSSYWYLYIGEGSGTPSPSDTALFTQIGTTRATWVDSNTYVMNVSYDSTTGMIIGRRRVYKGYFDYNITGVTEQKQITELGFRMQTGYLITHAMVYDAEGELSSITKNLNEKLTITVYFTAAIHHSIIENAYTNHQYLLIDPGYFATADISRRTMYGYRRYGRHNTNDSDYRIILSTHFDTRGSSATTTEGITSYTYNMSSSLIESTGSLYNAFYYSSDACTVTYSSNYVDRIVSTGFVLFTEDRLNPRETLEVENIWTNDDTSSLIDACFKEGSFQNYNYMDRTQRGVVPATDFDITSCGMYNRLTHSWEMTETFVSDANTDYCAEWITGALQIGVIIDNVSQWVFVFVNTRPDLPIEKFNDTTCTIWATDEYWDVSTYQQIPLPLITVPAELRSKKYYIRSNAGNNYGKLLPTRTMTHHAITPTIASHTVTLSQPLAATFSNCSRYYDSDCECSAEYGWVSVKNNIIYYSETETTLPVFPISGPENVVKNQFKLYSCGDIVITVNCDKIAAIRLYDMRDGTVESLPYQDVTLDWGEGVTPAASTLNHISSFTSGGCGYFVRWEFDDSIPGDRAVIVALGHGENWNTTTQWVLTDCKFATAVLETTYCAYLDQTQYPQMHRLVVYDMSTQTIVNTIDLTPAIGFSIMYTLIGWKNSLYVTGSDGISDYTWHCDITTGVVTKLDYHMKTFRDYYTNATEENNISLLSVENMFVVMVNNGYIGSYNISSDDECTAWMFKEDNPSRVIRLYTRRYDGHLRCTGLVKFRQLALVDGGKRLLLSYNTNGYSYYRTMYVMDIDRVLDNTTSQTIVVNDYVAGERMPSLGTGDAIVTTPTGFLSFTNGSTTATVIPREFMVEHKIIGTTSTIQAYNNPKLLTGRSLTFRVTNNLSLTMD